MKPGAEKDIQMPTKNPLDWTVDGIPVVSVHKTEVFVTDAEKTVSAVLLIDRAGHHHYLWDPAETDDES